MRICPSRYVVWFRVQWRRSFRIAKESINGEFCPRLSFVYSFRTTDCRVTQDAERKVSRKCRSGRAIKSVAAHKGALLRRTTPLVQQGSSWLTKPQHAEPRGTSLLSCCRALQPCKYPKAAYSGFAHTLDPRGKVGTGKLRTASNLISKAASTPCENRF